MMKPTKEMAEVRHCQRDCFDGNCHHWIITTNILQEEKDAQTVIHFFEGRGWFEETIGELRDRDDLDNVPCGQPG